MGTGVCTISRAAVAEREPSPAASVGEHGVIPDGLIVARVLEGDVGAFEELVKRYQGQVAHILSRHIPSQDVEDVAQEVFTSAFCALGKLRQPDSFGPWLRRITYRGCVNYWRDKKRRKEEALSELSEEHCKLLDASLYAER